MSPKAAINPQQEPPGIVAATLDAIRDSGIGKAAGAVWDAVFVRGEIAAAVRQGADEIGMFLKAFPDSVQTHEPGSVLNPIFSDISERQADRVPSVAEIIANPQSFMTPEQKNGNANDNHQGMSM